MVLNLYTVNCQKFKYSSRISVIFKICYNLQGFLLKTLERFFIFWVKICSFKLFKWQNRWKSGIFCVITLIIGCKFWCFSVVCSILTSIIQASTHLISLFDGYLFGIWLTSHFYLCIKYYVLSHELFLTLLVFLLRFFFRGMIWLSFTEFMSLSLATKLQFLLFFALKMLLRHCL